MRFYSPKQIYPALRLVNRHALLFVPLLIATFAIIAGWVASEYGTHYLFRDNETLNYFGFCQHTGLCIAQSARFHTALYATALMGMVWTLFVLIENYDDNPADLHPVGKVDAVLPGVFLLGLLMAGANLLNRGETEAFLPVLALTTLGYGAGLVVVAIVTKLGLILSQWIRIHQLWTFLGLSILLGGVVAMLPLVTPSKAILIVLAAAVIVYCAFEIAKVHYRFPLALAIFLLFMAGSTLPRFKYEFEGLEPYYRGEKVAGAEAVKAPLIEPTQALQAWLSRQSPKPKLVIVAASGGAYRATFWTATVLDRLAADPRLPGFSGSVRLMTGASGGMIGAAYFAASRQPPAGQESKARQSCQNDPSHPVPPAVHDDPTQPIQARLRDDLSLQRKNFWLANSQTDSLTPVVQRFIANDIPKAFVPLTNRDDRGRVLESGWQTLQLTFCDLATGEREGWRPSLIVSPYLVDLGQPMFISNLHLKSITTSKFGMEFFDKFPSSYAAFKVATAVRMSATFPFISPAVRLPLPERPRVVDAGYFDNFGITAAAMFLRSDDVRSFIENNGVQVILVRILAWGPQATVHEEGLLQRLAQGFEAVTSPLEGALAARETRGEFANTLLLENLKLIYGGKLDVFEFTNQSNASFSWHVQTNDLNEMKGAMSNETNARELTRLVNMWTR